MITGIAKNTQCQLLELKLPAKEGFHLGFLFLGSSPLLLPTAFSLLDLLLTSTLFPFLFLKLAQTLLVLPLLFLSLLLFQAFALLTL